jgi:heme oxygenase
LIKAIGIMVYNAMTRKRTKGSTELVTADWHSNEIQTWIMKLL